MEALSKRILLQDYDSNTRRSISLGGFDVITILRKQRQNITSCECFLEAERADTVPSVFTKITMDFQVSGDNLDLRKVERAVALSAEKYCSASKMLEDAGIELSHRVTYGPSGQSGPPRS